MNYTDIGKKRLFVTCRLFLKSTYFTNFSDWECIASSLRWLVIPCSIPWSLNYLVFNMIENLSLRHTEVLGIDLFLKNLYWNSDSFCNNSVVSEGYKATILKRHSFRNTYFLVSVLETQKR